MVNSSTINFEYFIVQLKKQTKVAGKKLFMPLRTALTGRELGPELMKIFNIMDKNIIITRLKYAIAMKDKC